MSISDSDEESTSDDDLLHVESKPQSEIKERKKNDRLGIIETFELITGLKDECAPQSNVEIMTDQIDTLEKYRHSIAITGNRSHYGDV